MQQKNRVLNSNGRILDLVLSTDHFVTEVSRYDFPLVPEDSHHPSLIISLIGNRSQDSSFSEENNSFEHNFYKANFEKPYLYRLAIELAQIGPMY